MQVLIPDDAGTRAQIIGTVNHQKSDPIASVTCIVDGIQQVVDDGRSKNTNNHCFCDARDLSISTLHTIEFSADVPQGSSLLFDRLQYRPLHNATLEKVVLAYSSDHPDIQYEGVWKSSDDRTAKLTQVTGSKATLKFTGTSLQWYGAYYPSYPRLESTGTWAIDGFIPQSFIVGKQQADNPAPLHNQLMFETGELKDEEHELEVVFKGDTSTVPLSLDSIVVQDGTISKTRTNTPNNTGGLSTGSGGGLTTGAKVGIGLAVSLAFIALLLLPFFFGPCNRKRKQARYRRQRALLPSPTRPTTKSFSRQNLIQPSHEQLPFIDQISVFESRPMVIHPNPREESRENFAPQLAYNPSSVSTIPLPNPSLHPYQFETITDSQLRDRTTSTSTIASSIHNPFGPTSGSCSTESTGDMTYLSTSSSNPWSHNHMPEPVNAASTAFEATRTSGRLPGELRDVKRSTPTFVYLQNDDMVGSTTTIGTIGTMTAGYNLDSTASNSLISDSRFKNNDTRSYR
ncbi:hypothetical protein BJ165DRAFT_875482 [Panaeolus papilionaceus]|nr:hypothetical protein BJ165DRAFT_875482 [Panaeolus papilionaceus]